MFEAPLKLFEDGPGAVAPCMSLCPWSLLEIVTNFSFEWRLRSSVGINKK